MLSQKVDSSPVASNVNPPGAHRGGIAPGRGNPPRLTCWGSANDH